MQITIPIVLFLPSAAANPAPDQKVISRGIPNRQQSPSVLRNRKHSGSVVSTAKQQDSARWKDCFVLEFEQQILARGLVAAPTSKNLNLKNDSGTFCPQCLDDRMYWLKIWNMRSRFWFKCVFRNLCKTRHFEVEVEIKFKFCAH